MDVEFCLQQGHADLHVRLRIGTELDADQIGLEKLEVRELEELLRPLIVAQNEACDREVDRIDDRQRDHAQIVPFDVPQQLMQRADAVLHEDAELPQAGPIAATGGARFSLRLAAVAHRRSPWLDIIWTRCKSSVAAMSRFPGSAGKTPESRRQRDNLKRSVGARSTVIRSLLAAWHQQVVMLRHFMNPVTL